MRKGSCAHQYPHHYSNTPRAQQTTHLIQRCCRLPRLQWDGREAREKGVAPQAPVESQHALTSPFALQLDEHRRMSIRAGALTGRRRVKQARDDPGTRDDAGAGKWHALAKDIVLICKHSVNLGLRRRREGFKLLDLMRKSST